MAAHLDLLLLAATCILLMTGFPAAFTLAGAALAFAGIGIVAGAFDPAYLSALPQRINGIMTNEVLIAVPLFIFMGVMLERTKVAEDLLETMAALFSSVRGGLGISVMVVGALMAASTGIVGATVVTMGLLSLPAMLRRGYAPSRATGAVAAAGTLGQIVPPSIVLVILGDQISAAYQRAQLEQGIFSPDTVSVGDLFAGALVPGLLLVGMYIIWLVLSGREAAAEQKDKVVPARIAGALARPALLIVAVLGSILAGIATPTEAASVGATGTLLIGAWRLYPDRGRPFVVAIGAAAGLFVLAGFADLRVARDTIPAAGMAGIVLAAALCAVIAWGLGDALHRLWRDGLLKPVCERSVRITAMVFVIVIGASLFSLVFRGLGGEETVTAALSDLPGGAFGAVLAVMVLMFVLGFLLDFLEIVFVVVPLVAPVLLQLEMPGGGTMSPVWLAVMMAVNLQTSFLTPPFGLSLFYLRGVAPDTVRTGDIYRGIAPFVAIQLIALLVLWYLPALATWLPAAIYGN